jgi:hypothetical protein
MVGVQLSDELKDFDKCETIYYVYYWCKVSK